MTYRLSESPESPWPPGGIHAPHLRACPLNSHGGMCTCPDLRTTSREITYNTTALLGEGVYDDEGDEE